MAIGRPHQFPALAYLLQLGVFLLRRLPPGLLKGTDDLVVAVHSQVLIKHSCHVDEDFLFVDEALSPQ